MAEVAYKEFAPLIKQGKIPPVVLFLGEEDFLIEEGIDAIIDRTLEPSARSFNLDIMDGSRADARDVVSHANSFPMMSEKRIVVVKDFDKLIGTEASQKTLLAYLTQPLDSTCLLLAAEKLDGRKRPIVEMKKLLPVVVCKPLWENQVSPWTATRFKQKGKTADAEACEMMISYVGTSLRAIDNEIDKVLISVGNRPTVTVEDIASVVGASRGFTIFELQDAIGERNVETALTILRKMLDHGESPVMIVAMLTRFVTGLQRAMELRAERVSAEAAVGRLKTSPFAAKKLMTQCMHFSWEELDRFFGLLLEADLQLKTSRLDDRVAAELLVHSMASRAVTTGQMV